MPTLITTLGEVNGMEYERRWIAYLFFSSLLVSKGCVPLDVLAPGVGVEDEALEDMGGRCYKELGIRRAMEERREGQGGGQLGRGKRKEKKIKKAGRINEEQKTG
jgi:hypothetical protein